jgi:hypothetical protein
MYTSVHCSSVIAHGQNSLNLRGLTLYRQLRREHLEERDSSLRPCRQLPLYISTAGLSRRYMEMVDIPLLPPSSSKTFPNLSWTTFATSLPTFSLPVKLTTISFPLHNLVRSEEGGHVPRGMSSDPASSLPTSISPHTKAAAAPGNPFLIRIGSINLVIAIAHLSLAPPYLKQWNRRTKVWSDLVSRWWNYQLQGRCRSSSRILPPAH